MSEQKVSTSSKKNAIKRRQVTRSNTNTSKAKRLKHTTELSVETNATLKTESTQSNNNQQTMLAFLRGVNVGGRVNSMTSIKEMLLANGYINVATFLASGNIIYETSNINSIEQEETRMESLLEELFGIKIPVFLRTMDDIKHIVDLVDKDQCANQRPTTAINVSLLRHELSSSQLEILESFNTNKDNQFVPLSHSYVWYSTTNMSESPFFKVSFEKKLDAVITMRTVNTLRRLIKKFGK